MPTESTSSQAPEVPQAPQAPQAQQTPTTSVALSFRENIVDRVKRYIWDTMWTKKVASTALLFLFGGDSPWDASKWTATDDRVRGGASQSYLEVNPSDPSVARFHGNLDFEKLGGAGFASQRTVCGDAGGSWDLSSYEGVLLEIVEGDDKNYTLTLADTLLPPDPQTGRDQSTISFEYDFTASNDCKGDTKPDEPQRVFIPWSSFRATFRGRDVDAPPIKTEAVRRISILIRR
ncbi:MAG: hypothetical protein M1815_001335 [Lichina confinis]|nr:MAG: hypothetical protein M1815_001335 [Lichina confinis]